ncbi:MAG TPA: M23 family metallopeptidase [Dermatophilaceae bacterium]|nr:M23 family metallopeptidase [Dermatophilaceae bacterium]
MSVARPFRHRTRVRMVCLGAVLATALSLGLVPASSADTSGDKKQLDAKIALLNTAIEGTSQDLAKAVQELQGTRAQLPGAQQALTAAEAAQVVADTNNQTMTTALAVAEANAAKATDAVGQSVRDNQAVQDQLANLVRNDYQAGGVSGLSIALEATSPEDFTDRIITMDTVMRVRSATLRGLDARRAQGQAGESHLVAVRQQVAALKVQAEASLAKAAAARKTAAAAKTKLDLLYVAQSEYEAAVAAKKASEITNLTKMQAESDSLMKLLASRAKSARDAAARETGAGGGSRSVPPNSDGGFLSPPLTAPVSSEFGMRFDPVVRVYRLHAGIDFAASCGSPVYAAAAGDVIMTTPESLSGGYGNRLIIDHGLQRGVDLTTTYNHLSRFVVTSGHVARGQVVAFSGTTGFSTGCHLHFETREDGTPVNPRLWL